MVLQERFEDDHERANGDIVVFMQMFDSLVITADTIRKLSRNDRFLSKFKHKFDGLECQTDWDRFYNLANI